MRRQAEVMRVPVAILAGATFYALAFPPWGWSPAAWVALVPLLVLIHGAGAGQALRYGAGYGFACAWALGSWIAPAAARYFEVGLAGGIALGCAYAIAFWVPAFGLFAVTARSVLRSERSLQARLLAVAALWVASEAIRGRLLGQPWGLIGYSQTAHVALIQVATLTAVYGLSFLVCLGNAALAEALRCAYAGGSLRRIALPLALPAGLVLAATVMGSLLAGPAETSVPGAQPVAIVQSGVEPATHWTRAYTDAQVAANLAATAPLRGSARPALIVWPENAVPRHLEAEPALGALLARTATAHGVDLLFGAPRHEDGRSFNSVRLLRANGRYGGHYDKQLPLPLAESDPLRLWRTEQVGPEPRYFSAGSEPGVLQSFAPLGISVCHEVLHPELVARSVTAGAQVLVNVANDGWLDSARGTAGEQHAAMAVLRAVETRRYLVRAATTGVSGIVDPFGRVTHRLAPRAVGTLTAPVVPMTALTPYVRLGDVFALTCALLGGWLAARPMLATSPRRRPLPAPAT